MGAKVSIRRRSGSTVLGSKGRGVMPDGTSWFSCQGKTVFPFMGTSTLSEYTVMPEISVVKRAALEVYHKGWGVSTIIGVTAAGQETWPSSHTPHTGWQCLVAGVPGVGHILQC